MTATKIFNAEREVADLQFGWIDVAFALVRKTNVQAESRFEGCSLRVFWSRASCAVRDFVLSTEDEGFGRKKNRYENYHSQKDDWWHQQSFDVGHPHWLSRPVLHQPG